MLIASHLRYIIKYLVVFMTVVHTYFYSLFSFLVPQIILYSYVNHIQFLNFLQPLCSLFYTLSISHFLITSKHYYRIMRVVELKSLHHRNKSLSRSKFVQRVSSSISGMSQTYTMRSMWNGEWLLRMLLKLFFMDQ